MSGGASINQSFADMGGYTCVACGQWAMWGYQHSCPGYYSYIPYCPPQNIYTNIVPAEVTEKLDQILKELQEIKELLK